MVVLSLLPTGCYHPHKVDDKRQLFDATASDSVVLEIQNHNWSDINVYILHDGRSNRLAMISAAKNMSIDVPLSLLGETGIFRLIVYRIGGTDSYVSEPLSIRTGNTIQLTVESALSRSSVGVW